MSARVMSTCKDSSDLLRKAEELRENDQLDQALEINNKAIDVYLSEKNYSGLCNAYQSRVLVYKHLFLISGNLQILEKAFLDANRSLKIAEEHNLENLYSSCFFRIGEILMLKNDFKKAADFYEKAVSSFSGYEAEKGDFIYHLGEAVWKTGDKKQGKVLLLDGLSTIQKNKSEVDSFLINVWESGACIRLAECLLEVDINEARKYFEQGEKIIELDDRLVIRKRQFEDLAKSFN